MKRASITDALNIIDNKVIDIDERLLKLEKIKKLLIEIKNEIIEPKCPKIKKIMEDYLKIKN